MKTTFDLEVIKENVDSANHELGENKYNCISIDPTTQYLNELRGFSRLNATQEYALWCQLDAARQAKARLIEIECKEDNIPITQDDALEVKLLKEKIQVGSYVQQQLIESAMPLVVFYAKKYAGRLPILDLIQEGNIALMKATEKYEYRESCSFASFSGAYIKHGMWAAMKKIGAIFIPQHMLQAIRLVDQFSDCFLRERGHLPAPEETAQEMKIPIDVISEVMEAKNTSEDIYSLDMPVGTEEDDCTLGDVLLDTSTKTPEEAVTQTMLHEKVLEILNTLEFMEAKVIKLHFGIEDGYARPLDEVCQECHIDKESVIRAEIIALRKLRHPSRSRQLAGFLYD